MKTLFAAALFDPQDHELLTIVNEVLRRERSRKDLKNLLVPYLHPNGIKELAATRELRIAYAVINLLDILETGGPEARLTALRSVRDEVLHSARSQLRNNTGRVMLQIMKELVRSPGDYRRQLELAHDFRQASSGKPRIVRAQLRRYHLLEMPEEWNQLAFDDHVHDANTKGRKSPTHLIMDAWIKGVRSLTVIHYNYVNPEAAEELLEAAEIMDLEVKINVEFSAQFRGRYVQLIWDPVGPSRSEDFLHLLAQPEVVNLMAEGRKVSEYQQRHVLKVLEEFNRRHRPGLEEAFGLTIPSLSAEEFRVFVGRGQASLVHLAAFAHRKLLPALRARTAELRQAYQSAGEEEKRRLEAAVAEMDRLDPDAIMQRYLSSEANPDLPDPGRPQEDEERPELLTYSPCALITYLNSLHASSRVTLNLSHLAVEDVLELLYDCRGRLTHLEIFNLKDYISGQAGQAAEITALQRMINQGDILGLKRTIKALIARLEGSGRPDAADRLNKLTNILHNVGALGEAYKHTRLKARLGSDSTGRSSIVPGMGLAVIESLPTRAQKEIFKANGQRRLVIPVRAEVQQRTTRQVAPVANSWLDALFHRLDRLPGLNLLGPKKVEDWVADSSSAAIDPQGNIVSLSGPRNLSSNLLTLQETPGPSRRTSGSWRYLNSGLRNALKVLTGFIPAFLTFYLTKEWWALAYLGAVIWFAITGLRNVIQSVLGGGGIKGSPLLRWKDYVSWERVADSLFFTGFSVPLLDYLVKTVLLDRGLGVTTATSPFLLYAVMALANGTYISGHNLLRGLPRGAIYGNFFRSLLSIPLAYVFNAAIGLFLELDGVVEVHAVLQTWAAIISKFASDCVAGVIEGLADRYNNLKLRQWDYTGKIRQVLDTFLKLELLFPEADVLEKLKNPHRFFQEVNAKNLGLEKLVIINALDMLFFWMYNPRARTMLKAVLRAMSTEERRVFERSQFVLALEREVSQMFVDGVFGKRFSRPLAFYLDQWEEYLAALRLLLEKLESGPETRAGEEPLGEESAPEAEEAEAEPLPSGLKDVGRPAPEPDQRL